MTVPEIRSAADREALLYERYEGSGTRSPALDAYYAVKPLVPRRVQLGIRRAYARRQARRAFPRWPVEPILVERRDRELLDAGHGAELVNFWPQGRRWGLILTHDVEGSAGVANVMRVIELERSYGFVSSWNFVAEWYPIPDGLFEAVRAAGCEIGLHGIRHDGRLFASREAFVRDLPRIRDYCERWGAVGFRSPSLHRNAEWMHELPVEYDSSFPDSDPFEPQSGGCCSIMPYRYGDVVELPLTLVQDHTLFVILREAGIERWTRKADWLMRHHGLVNVNVHPDYVIEQRYLDRYEALLEHLAEHRETGWHALPRDAARWWRERERLGVAADGTVDGPSRYGATVARVEAEGDGLQLAT